MLCELFDMSMKENLIFWTEAIDRADDKDNAGALERFSFITEPSARIYYNMAAIYLRQRNISQAEMVRPLQMQREKKTCYYFIRHSI